MKINSRNGLMPVLYDSLRVADDDRRERLHMKMTNNISFDELRNAMLYHRIVEWNGNYIRLDNGMELRIEETAQDCCASASGLFEDVELDAAITAISDIKYEHWEDGDTFGCCAMVTIMHNRNIICKAIGNADAGNGGYYYSIASFCVKMPNGQNSQCYFVGSDDRPGMD